MTKGRYKNPNQITILDSGDRVWPRKLAAECMTLKTKEERRAFIDMCPAEFREWIEILVRQAYAKRKRDGGRG